MKSLSKEAYRLISRSSGRFELQILKRAASLAQTRGTGAIESEHVTIAIQELVGDNPGFLQELLDPETAENAERRAG